MNAIQELTQQRLLLQLEYQTEKEAFRRQTEERGLARLVKRGDAWWPVRMGRSYYNSLNQLCVEVFRTADEEIEHNFEFGRPLVFFREKAHEPHNSHEPHESHESHGPHETHSPQQALGNLVAKWHALLPNAEILPISAKNKFGVDMLLKRIQELLPESPAFFDKDQLTDKPARFFVSQIIREKILLYYDKEIPYSVEIVVESFKEDDRQIHINAVIYVERDSQKGIIIGHQGVALKKVSTEARKALEKFFDKHIYLEVFVKVDKDWRSSERELDNFGYLQTP